MNFVFCPDEVCSTRLGGTDWETTLRNLKRPIQSVAALNVGETENLVTDRLEAGHQRETQRYARVSWVLDTCSQAIEEHRHDLGVQLTFPVQVPQCSLKVHSLTMHLISHPLFSVPS